MITTNNTPVWNVSVDELQQHPPFRFVTEILDCQEKTIETQLSLTGDEWFFKGHFPGLPIFPGVLQQEALFQSAALLMMSRSRIESGDTSGQKGLGVVTKVEHARFRKLITPPCSFKMQVELEDQQANAFYFKGNIKLDGKVVTQMHFTCAQISMLNN
jgi:3-hydroxyacyl-[acyl-carrier-protein] dehydratase